MLELLSTDRNYFAPASFQDQVMTDIHEIMEAAQAAFDDLVSELAGWVMWAADRIPFDLAELAERTAQLACGA